MTVYQLDESVQVRVIILTADRYYKRIRERIAADREAELDNVELDSIVYSDGWKADNKHSLNGFHHKRIDHDKTLANGKVRISGIETSEATPNDG